MRRFVTYLYHCENGTKGKVAGFLRVDQRGREVRMEVRVRDGGNFQGNAKVHLFVEQQAKFYGLPMGELMLQRGSGGEGFRFLSNNILDTGIGFSAIAGVVVRFDGGYLTSNWREESNTVLLNGNYAMFSSDNGKTNLVEREEEPVAIAKVSEPVLEVIAESLPQIKQETNLEPEIPVAGTSDLESVEQNYKEPIYKKIQLCQLRSLPPKNRHLCNNQFLIHSFYNYQYLILKKEETKEGEKWSIGAPGVYEKPERMMADLFGFGRFEAQDKTDDKDIREGVFGAWFIDVIT